MLLRRMPRILVPNLPLLANPLLLQSQRWLKFSQPMAANTTKLVFLPFCDLWGGVIIWLDQVLVQEETKRDQHMVVQRLASIAVKDFWSKT